MLPNVCCTLHTAHHGPVPDDELLEALAGEEPKVYGYGRRVPRPADLADDAGPADPV